MHLMDEDIITELVQFGCDGRPSEIVVTQLSNHASPLLRYRTGDVAESIAEDCECGRGLDSLVG